MVNTHISHRMIRRASSMGRSKYGRGCFSFILGGGGVAIKPASLPTPNHAQETRIGTRGSEEARDTGDGRHRWWQLGDHYTPATPAPRGGGASLDSAGCDHTAQFWVYGGHGHKVTNTEQEEASPLTQDLEAPLLGWELIAAWKMTLTVDSC